MTTQTSRFNPFHESRIADSRWDGNILYVLSICVPFTSVMFGGIYTEPYWRLISVNYVHSYLTYSLPLVLFSVMIFFRAKALFIVPLGIGTLPITLSTIIQYCFEWGYLPPTSWDQFQFLALVLIPGIASIIFLALSFPSWRLIFRASTLPQRLIAFIGFLTATIMLISEWFPWIRDISIATSSEWNFKGSGKPILIRDCCFLSDQSFLSSLDIVIPLMGLGALFLLTALKFSTSSLLFTSSIIWILQESIDFLTGLGIQDPFKIWNKADIEKYGLSSRIEGLPFGYIFVASTLMVICLVILPRVVTESHSTTNK